jgi:N-acetylglucosamine kinase-like BadF-type ATPase
MNASYIILVESGATKSEWRVLERGGKEVKRFFRAGMNVSTMRMEDVQATLAEAVGREGLMNAGGFYLYTAGIVTPEVRRMVEGLLREHFRIGDVDIQNDLTGAARAACGHRPGIAAILGTGSNTCFYDGEQLTQKVYSGGYVIGDEGSGASLGKRFLADYIKGLVPEPLATDFAREFDASYAGIVQGVYRSASPSGYLGSLAPMILRHYDHPYAKDLVDRNFQDFIDRSLLRYDVAAYPVGIVGGFGWACRDILRPLCEKSGIQISRFIQAPIEGLCAYHTE